MTDTASKPAAQPLVVRAAAPNYAAAAKDALFAGVITFGLFVLFIGLGTTQNIRNELVLVQRWGLLASFVAIAIVGRFILSAWIAPAMVARKATIAARPV